MRNPDPWGGNGYFSTILRATKMQDASSYSAVEQLDPAYDYATSAGKELLIREQKEALIKTAQDISTLIRDLKELWQFGGLDTLSDPQAEEASRAKAFKVAEMVEGLARGKPGGGVEGSQEETEEKGS